MKNLQFFKKFSRKFRDFFKNVFKFYLIFGKNLDKNLENLEIGISRGSGAEPPEASEYIKIRVENSMETFNF